MFFLFLVGLLLIAGYYSPVAFRLRFLLTGKSASLRLSMEMLYGLIHREHEFLTPDAMAGPEPGGSGGTAPPWWQQIKPAVLWSEAVKVRRRLLWYGLGGTLLSYFVPARFLPWLRVAGRLERKGRFARVHWRTVIGMDEAAATGLLTGLTWALKWYLLTALDRRYGLPRSLASVKVEPSFTGRRFSTDLDCIFELRAGHIIQASVRSFLLDKLQGSVARHDERPPNRGSHEDGHAEHQRDGRR